MTCDLENCIKDSFDDTMKDCLESDEYKQETWEFNTMYFELRRKLSPDEQAALDTLFTSMQNSDFALAKEAYYRGMIIGTAQNQKVLGDLGLEC